MEGGKKRQQIIVGLALIAVGLVLFALKYVDGLGQWAIFSSSVGPFSQPTFTVGSSVS